MKLYVVCVLCMRASVRAVIGSRLLDFMSVLFAGSVSWSELLDLMIRCVKVDDAGS